MTSLNLFCARNKVKTFDDIPFLRYKRFLDILKTDFDEELFKCFNVLLSFEPKGLEIKLDFRHPMTLPMLRILPPPWDFRMMTSNNGVPDGSSAFSDKYEPIRKLSMVQVQPPRNPNKPFTSFGINDILNSNGCKASVQHGQHHSSKKSSEKHLNNIHSRHSLVKQDISKHRRTPVSRHGQPQIRTNQQNHNNNQIAAAAAAAARIVRPWDSSPTPGRNSEASSEADEEEINVDDDVEEPTGTSLSLKDVSPLDALMEMANKTFQGLETSEAAGKRFFQFG